MSNVKIASQVGASVISGGAPPILIILCGLVASGKTNLSRALEIHAASLKTGSGRRWVRVSQDDSATRDRRSCEELVRRTLLEGDNVIVDRMNFDPQQRSYFLQIARSLPIPPQTWCLVLNIPLETLKSRLETRTDHPTIMTPEEGVRVLEQMKYQYRPPTPGLVEGFDRILELTEMDQPRDGVWSAEGLERLLERIADGHREARGRVFMPRSSRGGFR